MPRLLPVLLQTTALRVTPAGMVKVGAQPRSARVTVLRGSTQVSDRLRALTVLAAGQIRMVMHVHRALCVELVRIQQLGKFHVTLAPQEPKMMIQIRQHHAKAVWLASMRPLGQSFALLARQDITMLTRIRPRRATPTQRVA